MHSCCFKCKVVAHQLNFLGRCRDRSWCLDPSTPDCPRNVEGTFSPSGLIGSLAPAKYFIAFLQSPNPFHRPFSGNPRYLVKRRLRSKLYFCGDLKWMSRPPLLQIAVLQTCFELQPFFAGPCPVLPSYDKRCKRCGVNEKMLILSPKWLWSDDVRWSDAMTDQNFKRVSDDSQVCAVLTQNDPCVRYCADAFM